MGRGSSGRSSGTRQQTVTLPTWGEAFGDGNDYQSTRDVDHVSRTVTRRLQRDWDQFADDYQSGITSTDVQRLMKDYDPYTDSLYGYVRTSNSFAINEKLYDDQNANKTDDQIFTRRDRRGVLRDLQTVQTLDKAINSHTTKSNATYTRFSTSAAVQALYGLNNQQMSILQNARGMNAQQLKALNDTFAGKTSYSRAYTSTSANRSMNAFGNLNARHSRSMVFERKLYMPQGTNAFAVKQNAQESEVIFGRHANTKLMKVTVASDGHIVLHEMFTGYNRH